MGSTMNAEHYRMIAARAADLSDALTAAHDPTLAEWIAALDGLTTAANAQASDLTSRVQLGFWHGNADIYTEYEMAQVFEEAERADWWQP